jgi:homoserine kinase
MERSVKVFAPATISNVGPGFDLLGFAIDEPGDVLIIRPNKKNTFRIINNTCYPIPENPAENVATIAADSLLRSICVNQGFDFIFESKITPGSGIGSSAASCTAAVTGINHLLSGQFKLMELLPFALEGEKMASGSLHADNIAPALLGGFILIRSYNPLDIIRINYSQDLLCVVVHPNIEIKTSESRKLLPKELPLKTVIQQCGNIAGLISGLNSSDFNLIGRTLDDAIAEPLRADSIPGYHELKSRMKDHGAIGGSISGSGPSVFAMAGSYKNAEKLASFMSKIFNDQAIENKVYISKISSQGSRIIN